MGLLTCIDLTEWIKIWMWHILMPLLGWLDCKSDFFSSKGLIWKNEANMSHKWSKFHVFWKNSAIRKDPPSLLSTHLSAGEPWCPVHLFFVTDDSRFTRDINFIVSTLDSISFLQIQGCHSCHSSFLLLCHQVLLLTEVFSLLTCSFYFFYIMNKNKANTPNNTNNNKTPLLTNTLFLRTSAPAPPFFVSFLKQKLLRTLCLLTPSYPNFWNSFPSDCHSLVCW